jgi:hypothetical protein
MSGGIWNDQSIVGNKGNEFLLSNIVDAPD